MSLTETMEGLVLNWSNMADKRETKTPKQDAFILECKHQKVC